MERNKTQYFEIVGRNIELEVTVRKYVFYWCIYMHFFYHMFLLSLDAFLPDLVTSNLFSELLEEVLWPSVQRRSC